MHSTISDNFAYHTKFTKMNPAVTTNRLQEFITLYESSFQYKSSPKQEHTLKSVGAKRDLEGFYIEKDGTIAGYIIASIKQDSQSVYIEQVCIAPDYQQLGLGTDLVNLCVDTMTSHHNIHNFTLMATPQKAHNMYAKTALGPVTAEKNDVYHYHVA